MSLLMAMIWNERIIARLGRGAVLAGIATLAFAAPSLLALIAGSVLRERTRATAALPRGARASAAASAAAAASARLRALASRMRASGSKRARQVLTYGDVARHGETWRDMARYGEM